MPRKLTLPEIDALVAEKVLGWVTPRGSWVRVEAPWVTGGGYVQMRRSEVAGFLKGRWSPTCSIADAWEVVENIAEFRRFDSEPFLGVAIFVAQKGQIGCRIYRCNPGSSIFDTGARVSERAATGKTLYESVASTAPLAICLAALRAVGEDVEVKE